MKYFIIFLIVYMLCGCKTEEHREVAHVVVNKASESFFDAGKEFDFRHVVFLETTDKSLIGHVSKVVVANGKLYVFDKNTNSVVLFDKDGKFLSAIRPSGKGPGEYFSMADFSFDRKRNQIFLLALGPGKILVYDENGKFEYEMFYDNLGAGMAVVNDGLSIVSMNGEDKPYLNFIRYKDGKITDVVASDFKHHIASDLYTQGALIMQGEKVNFARRFDNTVYSIEEHNVVPRFYLDFGESNLPDRIMNLSTDEERQEEMKKGDYVYTMLNIKETANNFYMSVNKGGFVVLDKAKKEAVIYRCVADMDLGIKMGWVVGVEDEKNEYVGYATNRLYLMIGCNGQWDELEPAFKENVMKLKEDSNPILILYRNES